MRPAVHASFLALTTLTTLTALTLLSTPTSASAQSRSTLSGAQVGDTVRFRTLADGKRWTMVRIVDGDSAALVGLPTTGSGPQRVVPGDSLRDMELYIGRRSRAEALGRNLFKTALIGGAGTLVIIGLFEASDEDESFISNEAAGGIVGGALTVGAGAIVALHSIVDPGEKWRRLDVRTPRGVLPVVRRSQLTGWNLGVKFKVR